MESELIRIAREENIDIGEILDRELQAHRNFKIAYWSCLDPLQLEKDAVNYAHDQICIEMMRLAQNKYQMRVEDAEID